MHGVEVGELRLPVGASVAMLIREGQTLVPERRTVLKRGDDMLVVTPRKLREATEHGCAPCRSAAGSRSGSRHEPYRSSRLSAASRSRCPRWTVTDCLPLRQAPRTSLPTTTSTPGAQIVDVAPDDLRRRHQAARHQADVGTLRVVGPDLGASTGRCPGRVAGVARARTLGRQELQGLAGQAGRVPALRR